MVSTGSRHSSNPFHYAKGMISYSSIPHDRTDACKASVFSRFVASPPFVGNTTVYFILVLFSSPYVSTILPSSAVFNGDLPAPQCWPGIWRWWIIVFSSSSLIFLLPMSFVFSCFTWIEFGNETGSPSDALVASVYLCGTIISILNCSPSVDVVDLFISKIFSRLSYTHL